MKVLTIREPWLTCILRGSKNVENRGIGLLSTFERLTGQTIGLHGARSWSTRGASDPRVCAVLGGMPRPPERVGGYLTHPTCDSFGLIVGTARIDDVHVQSPICQADVCFPWGEALYENADGSIVRPVIHVELADVVVLECVIPAAGRLGLWECAELDEELAS